ncbi:DRTGG domain-containing protein [Halovivax asiaticus JCM 14624]|uniref:DRTGG domain-containing protein n=1 Tax=Halovivax asiaticus JCM 14624 TaxID=1227490 RepID=M0BRF3_9EURY|nr:phosphotransacetylase family protein [Halovivax asiaticus]ELZ13576.1 DRTGG domain-containing protein [Halovivax asiaticus JCM 14624]
MTDTDTIDERTTSDDATDRSNETRHDEAMDGPDDTRPDDATARQTDARPDGGAETLLIASLEESTGKTAITLALAQLASDNGERVGYMKPKGTRLQSNVGKTLDADPLLAKELLGIDADVSTLEPIVYSPTFVEQVIRGRETPETLRKRVREAFDELASETNRMFVEGAGEYTVGEIIDLTDADVADLLDARVVLVAPYEHPGDVDDVLAASRAFGDRLAGVIFNDVADAAYDDLETDVVPFLEGRGVPVYGIVPRVQELSGVTVADLADELGASVLVEEGTDRYVERFSVAAMGADSALRYFRRTRDAAVITGGDRADVQAAALEASGIRCLILTGGHHPSGRILGTATERSVPILSVQSDTLTTVERTESIVRGGRTQDEATVRRMHELLTDHAAVAELFGSE